MRSVHHEPSVAELRELGLSPYLAKYQMDLTDIEHAAYHKEREEIFGDPGDTQAYEGLRGKMSPVRRFKLDLLLNNKKRMQEIHEDIIARHKNI